MAMELLKATLNYLGINCWFHGHKYFGATDTEDKSLRICQKCPKMQIKVNNQWITYKKEVKWLKKLTMKKG